jgi:hypothetical protein
MIVQITENEILHLGLSTAGFKESQRETSITRKLDRFRACYGPMPKTASDIFGWIQEEDRAGVFHISKPNAVYFLMSLCWLNSYETETNLAGKFGVSEVTVRTWTRKYTLAIQALKSSVVSIMLLKKYNIMVSSKTFVFDRLLGDMMTIIQHNQKTSLFSVLMVHTAEFKNQERNWIQSGTVINLASRVLHMR